MSKKKTKAKIKSIRFDDADHKDVSRAANKENRTFASWVRHCAVTESKRVNSSLPNGDKD